MTFNRYIYAKILIILSIWWGWTVLVDFFVVPTVFQMIDMFFKAGELGIELFSKLNGLEVILGSALVVLLSIQTKKNRKALPLLIMAVVLWIIAMFYFGYLSPKISELTEYWKQADLLGLVAIAGYPDIQQAHQYYHHLYIGLDTFKLILITVMLTYAVVKEKSWS